MIADLGTRRGATFKDINQSSSWINGFEWMHRDSSSFPMKSVKELKLTNDEVMEVNKEQTIQVYHNASHSGIVPDEVNQR